MSRLNRLPFRPWAIRALIGALAVRVVDLLLGVMLGRAPRAVQLLDTLAAVVIAAAAVYLLAWGIVVMRRALLWRVRRKLIISYVFIGLVPALLLLAFFALGAVLLFYNFSAYLVRSELQVLVARVDGIARSAAASTIANGRSSTLAEIEAETRGEFPSASLEIVSNPCVDQHADAPLPDWIGCRGFDGIVEDGAVSIRAVRFASATAREGTLVTVPVDGDVRKTLRDRTGVLVLEPSAASSSVPEDAPPLTSIAYVESRDWQSGRIVPQQWTIRLGLSDIYNRISAGPGLDGTRNVVMLLLAIVGGLFLVIELVAFGAGFNLARSITGSVHELFVGTERVGRSDFAYKIAVSDDDQLGALARSFNDMTANIERLLHEREVGSSRVDLQACKLEYSIVSPK